MMYRDFDDILATDLKELGRYQIFVVIVLVFPACILNAFIQFSMVFIAYTPTHGCQPWDATNAPQFENWTLSTNDSAACNCDGTVVYDDTFFKDTIVTKWDLICDKQIQSKVVLSIMGAFSIIGCYILAIVQDKYGRKWCLLWSITLHLIPACGSLAMPNLIAFAALRSISHMPSIQVWNVTYVWALEFTGPKRRTLVSTLLCALYPMGEVLLGGIAYFCDSWIQLGLITSVPFFALYLLYFLGESPRWLIAQGREKEAVKVIKTMAKWDNLQLSEKQLDEIFEPKTDLTPLNNAAFKMGSTMTVSHTLGVMDLFRGEVLRRKTLLITTSWFAITIVYISISYNAENIKGNFILIFCLMGIVEAPACFFNPFILDRIGRILPLSFCMILSGIGCFVSVMVSNLGSGLIITSIVVGKFCITCSYAIIYQLASELYPTEIRGIGTGFSSMIGIVGVTVMPFIIHSAQTHKDLPMIILSILAALGGLLILFLPETLNTSLPDTLEEAETTGKVGFQSMWSHIRALKNLYKNGGYRVDEVNLTNSKEKSSFDEKVELRNGVD